MAAVPDNDKFIDFFPAAAALSSSELLMKRVFLAAAAGACIVAAITAANTFLHCYINSAECINLLKATHFFGSNKISFLNRDLNLNFDRITYFLILIYLKHLDKYSV